jgi:hypothetical protein
MVEQGIQGPAHPKILFDILDCGADTRGGGVE